MTLTKQHIREIDNWFSQAFAARNTKRPSEWCCENLVFDESDNHGQFRLAGREYCAEPLDDFANVDIADEVLIWGSQTGKTGLLMGGMAFAACCDPCGVLWVMPSMTLAQKFARQRWLPMLRASDPTRAMIPTGDRRHDFASMTQILGAASFNFVGSNSPSNLSSMPCRRVVLDEVDKFDRGGREEADALNLAEQRTKDMLYPQRWKTSTPTLEGGIIWQEAQKGILKRYFGPCPHCKKMVVPAWSRSYTVFPIAGDEAFVEWDKEAKLPSGRWDLERVEKSARLVCPHCQGHIRNHHRTAMTRNGKWKTCYQAENGKWIQIPEHTKSAFIARHLPSLWSNATETSLGKLALKFLQAKHSVLGVQGFVNGELAEPYRSQDKGRDRVELVRSEVEITNEWKTLLTLDHQQASPHFWYCVRAWGQGKCHGVEAGALNKWEDIESLQMKFGIPNMLVGIDQQYSTHEVIRQCVKHAEIVEPVNEGLEAPEYLGWCPMAGTPKRDWKSEQGSIVPFRFSLVEPNASNSLSGLAILKRLDFWADYFEDLMEGLRDGNGGWGWTVGTAMDSDDYRHHMNSMVRNETSGHWEKRSHGWPNHLRDCEKMQTAFAVSLGILELK